MFKNLAQPFIDRLLSETISEMAVLFNSEMLANVERLLVHMYTGNPQFMPTTFWRRCGILDSMRDLGWPSLSQEFAQLRERSIAVTKWPRDKEGNLIFL